MNLAALGAVTFTAAAQATATAPPGVNLQLVAPTTHGRWTVRVTNASPVPVRILADLRLLSLDVTPRSSRTIHCELPEEMQPDDDLVSHRLIVPPGRAYSESFDPRLFCFGGGLLDAVAPGAAVVAHLGWHGAAGARPRLEVAPVPGTSTTFAGIGRLDSPPIAVPDEPTARQTGIDGGARGGLLVDSGVSEEGGAPDPEAPRLRITGARAIDAESPDYVEIPVTIENRGPRSVTVRFRPETLSFDIEGPSGSEHCTWPLPPPYATVETFTTLGPRESTTMDVLLASYCRGQGMARPGLLLVRPSLDTTDATVRASGHDLDARAFHGVVAAPTPTLLRLRHAARNQVSQPIEEPGLEPAKSPDLRDPTQ